MTTPSQPSPFDPGESLDVSCNAMVSMLLAAKSLGVDVDGILSRLGIFPDIAYNRREFISWNTAVRLTNEVCRAWGPPEREILIGHQMAQPKFLGKALEVVSFFTTPRMIYWVIFRFAGHRNFPQFQTEYKTLPNGTIWTRMSIPSEYSPFPAFFRISQGLFEMLPTGFGLKPSLVQSTISDRECQFWITPPISRDFLFRFRLAWRCLFRLPLMMEEVGFLYDQARDRLLQLSESKRDFLRVIEKMPDAVIIRYQNRILYTNHSFQRLLGEYPGNVLEKLDGLDESRPAREMSIETRDGQRLLLECSSPETVTFDDLPASLIMIRDTTARRELEQKLMERRSLMMLGEVAAEMAHEIRNPLSVIQLAGERVTQLRDSEDGLTQARRISEKILNHGERISKIMDQLSRFSRDCTSDPPTPTRVSNIIQDALIMCGPKLRHCGINVSVPSLSTDFSLLYCRPEEVTQVLVNLINNACDALEGKDPRWILIETSQDSTGTLISLTDSGDGIPVESRERIFDSFYTTKKPGKGTGLGLSISRRIMALHRGTLELDSSSDHTRFLLKFPSA